MRSCCVAQGAITSHLWWNMMEDNVRKRMYICMCDWVTFLCSRKLTEHCKPAIMEKIKIIIKKWDNLGIYPDKTLLKRDTCTHMFIAALFTIARTWKQPKCPSTDDWIWKMWSIYTMEYYSAIKKNDIMPFAATWMELETLILSEMSQKDKYHMISLITGI